MDIFLLRHFESIKNTQITFSSIDDKEELTEKGIIQGKCIAKDIRKILELKGLNISKIYCADSIRAIHSAKIIADTISQNIVVEPHKEFLSTKSKELMGKTKDEVRNSNPLFMKELSLYDAGLFNSYDFHRDINKEKKIIYERMVCGCLKEIINNSEPENAKLFCLHNSSITAIAIHFARKIYNYPNDYYGKVIADNGKIFWIHCDESNMDFWVANCESEYVVKLISRGNI